MLALVSTNKKIRVAEQTVHRSDCLRIQALLQRKRLILVEMYILQHQRVV